MKNIIIITPVYNDWESFSKLIIEINKNISTFKDISFKLIAVNDGSKSKAPQFKLPSNLESIEILNMKKNQGHGICFANGIKYALKNFHFNHLILMDADGEDRPEELVDLINEAKKHQNISVVAKRVKRSEGIIFRILYHLHKFITLVFTGKLINFGNYSILTKEDAELIINDPTIINSIPGTIKNKIKKLESINCVRGVRYFGPSKMPLFKLILLSFSIISVFKMNVFIRSALLLVLLSYLYPYFGFISPLFQIMIVIFNIFIYLISTKSSNNRLNNLDEQIGEIDKVTH